MAQPTTGYGMPPGGMPPGGMPQGGMPPGGMPQGGMPPGGMPQGGMPPGGGGRPPQQQIQAAAAPSVIPMNTPPGLEFLLATPGIYIQQQIEWGEILLGMHTNNRYHILDAWGRRMFFAAEDSDCCSLACLGSCRPWNINIYNQFGQPVMSGTRDSSCGACGNTIKVTSSAGYELGGVVQTCNGCSASWDIVDHTSKTILTLESPACSVICPRIATCGTADFPLFTVDGHQEIGKVTKFFGSLLQEMLTAADTFGVTFPADLDPKIKAVLIYATFMIDFMYYEDVNSRQHHHHGYGGYGGF